MRTGALSKDNSFSPSDFFFMNQAFTLAKRGKGKTSPNPMVGAVIVKDGNVIGKGWHRRHGGLHAEAEAVKSVFNAGFSPAGADLYCNLEPCCFNTSDKHQPPCTDLIIKNGIKRVYIANFDPNPKVNGKGIALLEKAGIKTKYGLCSEIGEELNRAFFTFHRLRRPFVHLKIAQSLDGRIAMPDGSSRWITDETARRMVHRFRAEYDAVLVGRGTVIADDPELTARLVKGRSPFRIILDSALAIPETAKVLSLPEPEKTIIFYSDTADTAKVATAAKLSLSGAKLISVKTDNETKSGGLPLKQVLTELGKMGIQSVFAEGGAGILSSFLRERFWDRLSIFTAPVIFGGGVNSVFDLGLTTMAEAMRFNTGIFRRIGSQMLFETDCKHEGF